MTSLKMDIVVEQLEREIALFNKAYIEKHQEYLSFEDTIKEMSKEENE